MRLLILLAKRVTRHDRAIIVIRVALIVIVVVAMIALCVGRR
jgi:hypothetical protein